MFGVRLRFKNTVVSSPCPDELLCSCRTAEEASSSSSSVQSTTIPTLSEEKRSHDGTAAHQLMSTSRHQHRRVPSRAQDGPPVSLTEQMRQEVVTMAELRSQAATTIEHSLWRRCESALREYRASASTLVSLVSMWTGGPPCECRPILRHAWIVSQAFGRPTFACTCSAVRAKPWSYLMQRPP